MNLFIATLATAFIKQVFGIYKTGFATRQQAYEKALNNLFYALDIIEDRLQGQDYLQGSTLTESDLRLLPSLIRFDAVYFIHFKASTLSLALGCQNGGYGSHQTTLFFKPSSTESQRHHSTHA